MPIELPPLSPEEEAERQKILNAPGEPFDPDKYAIDDLSEAEADEFMAILDNL